MNVLRHCAFVVTTATLLAAGLLAQNPTPPVTDPAAPAPTPAPAARPTEWPQLKDTDKDRVTALIGQFRKEEALHAPARAQLIAIGAGAAPLLFQHVTDRPENQNAQLFLVLDGILRPEHAALIARESKKQKVELRRYLVEKLCRFTDKDMAPVLQATIKDKDEDTAFYASLGLLALRHKDALPAVLLRCKTGWPAVRGVVGDVLPAARSAEAAQWVFDAIGKATPVEQAAGLNLLRSLAVAEQAAAVRPYLEANDHNVKKAAVNCMRVLHGQEAIENMTVFQAIEMAKEWAKK